MRGPSDHNGQLVAGISVYSAGSAWIPKKPVLVIAEHDHLTLNPATLNTITAAAACSGEVHVLVAGANPSKAGLAAAQIAGVVKVIVADGPRLG